MAVADQLKISADGLAQAGEPFPEPGAAGAYRAPEAATTGYSLAGDVWSLGVLLVEALTQSLPSAQRTPDRALSLPPLPQPFADIARECLRLDPARRWTVSQIQARLHRETPAPSAIAPHLAAQPPHTPTHKSPESPAPARKARRFLVLALAVGVAAALALVTPRLFDGISPDADQPASVAPSQGSVPNASSPSLPRSPDVSAASQREAVAVSGAPTSLPAMQSIIPGKVQRRMLPPVPESARQTIRGTVRVVVKVAVDEQGRVVGAELELPGPSRYFARLALEAARQWEFSPPQVGARPLASQWLLRFGFSSAETTVAPAQVVP